MKLTYIANARIPTEKAHGKQIIKTCEALASHFDLTLLVPKRDQPASFLGVDPFTYYAAKPNFKINYLPNIDFLKQAAALPHFVQAFCFLIQNLSFAVVVASKRLDDPIYTRSFLVASLLSFTSKKLFFEAHNIPSFMLVKKITSYFLNRLTGVIVISNGLLENYQKMGVKKIIMIPDGFDPKAFEGLVKKPNPKKTALYAGSLQPGKGVDVLEATKKKLPSDIELVIIHNKPPLEVPQFLVSADLLLLPNSGKDLYSNRYTSPMKLFEYLGSGTPIIASGTPANREVLNSENSILIEPDNSEILVSTIQEALKDPKLLAQISKQAKLDAKNYTWEKRADHITNFITTPS